MHRDLAAFAISDAPLEERIRVARALARAVAALHARGKVHGALDPVAVTVLAGGEVVLAPAPAPDAGGPLARAGWVAPEVARGGRATARSDAFSLGALAWLALAGRPPFEATEPLERVRRVLFEDAGQVRLRAPEVPAEVDGAIAALLDKAPRRRGAAARLIEAIDGATAPATPASARSDPFAVSLAPPNAAQARRAATETSTPTSTPTSTSTSTPTSTPTPIPTSTPLPTATSTPTPVGIPAIGLRLASATAAATTIRAALRALSPVQRAGLAVLPLVVAAVLLAPESDAALSREIATLLERGDVAAARRRVDEAARSRPGAPLVEKLRGDLACARGAPGECLRRYRVALAARPELREDEALRANARRLLSRDVGCGTRRAAAQLLGELRDPDALPALEAARRSGGFLAVFCTGDSIERAIAATRADLPR